MALGRRRAVDWRHRGLPGAGRLAHPRRVQHHRDAVDEVLSAGAACLTCELLRRLDHGDASLWDSIHRTKYWDLVHSFDSSLLGWLVLIARRHIEAVADLTDEEAAELGPLVRDVSR